MSTNTQYNNSAYNQYVDDYVYAKRPTRPTEDPSLGGDYDAYGWDEAGFGEEIPGGQASVYEDGATPKADLAALQDRVRTSGLTTDQQAKLLNELNEFAGAPEGEYGSEGLSEFEEKLSETIQNKKGLAETEAAIKQLKEDIKKNPDLSARQRKDILNRIKEFEKNLAEDPALKLEDELSDILAMNQEVAARNEARTKEATRTQGAGTLFAAELDLLFEKGAQGGSSGAWSRVYGALHGAGNGAFLGAVANTTATAGGKIAATSFWSGAGSMGVGGLKGVGYGAIAGAAAGLAIGAFVGEEQAEAFSKGNMAGSIAGGLAGAGIGVALGGPAGAWAGAKIGSVIGGAVGGTIGYALSETDVVTSKQFNLDQSGQKLDLVMKGQFGLANSKIPGQVAEVLYDMSLTQGQQMEKIQGLIKGLKLGPQAFALSTVVNLISQQDPAKFQYLNENCPELVQFLGTSIERGSQDIQNGGAAGQGDSGGYKVEFTAGGYKIINTDTEWYRNDWNDFVIGNDVLMAPMTNALSALRSPPAMSEGYGNGQDFSNGSSGASYGGSEPNESGEAA